MSNLCGHGIIPSPSICTEYSGGLTNRKGREWAKTFQLELCEDTQTVKQVALTSLSK